MSGNDFFLAGDGAGAGSSPFNWARINEPPEPVVVVPPLRKLELRRNLTK